jgi:hypothetical protein
MLYSVMTFGITAGFSGEGTESVLKADVIFCFILYQGLYPDFLIESLALILSLLKE